MEIGEHDFASRRDCHSDHARGQRRIIIDANTRPIDREREVRSLREHLKQVVYSEPRVNSWIGAPG